MANEAEMFRWLRDYVQIPEEYLPTTSIYIQEAYLGALDVTDRDIRPFRQYNMAVYNLTADNLFNWCPDLPGVVYKTEEGVNYGYFEWFRKQWGINSFTGGMVNHAYDEGTGATYSITDIVKNLTFSDLLNTKTPYGRQYLAIAGQRGDLWGLS